MYSKFWIRVAVKAAIALANALNDDDIINNLVNFKKKMKEETLHKNQENKQTTENQDLNKNNQQTTINRDDYFKAEKKAVKKEDLYISANDYYAPDLPKKTEIKVEHIKLSYEQAIEQGWHFRRKSRKRIRITNYTGSEKKIIVPSEIDGHIVNELGKSAFYKSDIESIEIPDTIKKIGDNCVRESNVEIIRIAEGIRIIPNCFAFGCKNLKEVKLPTTLFTIKSCAFESCPNLTYINIPSSCFSIERYAFARTGLKGFAYHENGSIDGTAFLNTPLEKEYIFILKEQLWGRKRYNIVLFGNSSNLKDNRIIKFPANSKVLFEANSIPYIIDGRCILDFSECAELDISLRKTQFSDNCYGKKIEFIVPMKFGGVYFPKFIDVHYPDGQKYDGYMPIKNQDSEQTTFKLYGTCLPKNSIVCKTASVTVEMEYNWATFEEYAVCSKSLERITFESLSNGKGYLFSPLCESLHYIQWGKINRLMIPSSELIGWNLHTKLLKSFKGEYNFIFSSKVIDEVFLDSKNELSQKQKILIAVDVMRSSNYLFKSKEMYTKYLQTHKRYANLICDSLPKEYSDFLHDYYKIDFTN